MKNSLLKRILVFITVSSIIAQSFSPYVAILSQRAYAQEITDQATSTDTQTTTIEESTPTPEAAIPTSSQDQTTPTETVTPTSTEDPALVTPTSTEDPALVTPTSVDNLSPPISSVEPAPISDPSSELQTEQAPQPVIEKECLSNEVIVDTTNDNWNIDLEKGTSETKEKVKLGVKYVFPQENKVSITFKCLPKNDNLRTSLKIQQIKVSDLQLPEGINPYGEYAYDITTGMQDGNFEYEITLPKPTNQSVEIIYMEGQNSAPTTIDNNQTSQEGDKIKANDINHFTIFVVVNPNPAGNGSTSNDTCLTSTVGGAVTCYNTLQAAIDAAINGDTININSNISVNQMVIINKDVLINGNGFTVSPTFTKTSNSNNAAFGIVNSGVTISNLIIDGASGTNLHGINIYTANNVLLDGVSVLNNDYAGVVVNGSTVTVNNITTAGNGWGGINVDQGTGVITEARLIITGTSSHNEGTHIWLDDTTKDVSVQDTNPHQYNFTDYGNLRVYMLKTSSSSNPSASLEQCRNGAAGSPNNCLSLGGSAGWVNGNAGALNSHYVEGYSIPYRTIMTDLPIGTPVTITLGYDIKHSGAHAIDFLTHYNRLQPHSPFGHSAETINPTDGVSGISATITTFAIPAPSSVGSPVAGQPTTRFNSLPAGEKLMTLFGGTISGMAYVSEGTLTDSTAETRISVTFTPDSSTAILAWGGHIAQEIDWGLNNSAGGINGSPYHMRLINWTLGNLGNQDRSLSADAIAAPSSITIVKDAQPNDAQDFAFATTGNGLSSFSLDDDSDNTLSNSTIFSSLLAGSYSVAETLVNGWTLNSKSCVTDGTSNTTSTFGQITNGVSINLVAGENVTCTFVNTKDNGSVKVNKLVDTNGDGIYEGDNTTATSLGFTWNLDGSGTNNNFGSTISSVNTGSHNINENLNSQPYHFVGWFPTESTQYSCTNPQGTTLPINVNVTNNTLTEITLCNAANKGHLIVQKTTVPSADQTVFTINATGSGTITNGGAGTVTDSTDKDYEVAPGNYWVTETVPAGWSKTGDTCQNVAVAAGQTAYCLLTNTKLGSITVVKNTNFGDGIFPFSTTGGLDPVNFNITTSGGTGSKLYSSVLPGSYSVTENTPASWAQGTISCVDGTDPIGTINGSTASFTLPAGHSVICTFNNTGQGQLKIVKNTIGGNDTFGFTVNGPTPLTPNILTSGGTGNTGFNTVTAGNYSVSETTIPSNWTLTGASCTNGQASLDPTGFDVNAGDYVTCTFENKRDTGTIIVKKVMVGGTGSFDFTGDVTGTISTDSGTIQQTVNTGTYTSTEATKTGWTLTNISCNDGTSNVPSTVDINARTATFNVESNETITCTFTNNKPAAQIDLSPLTATNKIGEDHVITANVQVQNGNGSWGPAPDGTLVTFSITNSSGATASFVGSVNTCTTTSGTCSVTINSPTVGHVEVNASSSPVSLGVTLPVSTGTGGDNSTDAQKDYINARISIAPNSSTNEVNDDHNFTVTVEQNTGSGWSPVSAGTLANAIITPSAGIDASDCTNGVNASGQCTVTVNSGIAGVFTITARSTVSINGVEFKLQTNGQGENSAPAQKTYVDASIELSPQQATNDVNDPHTIVAHVTKNDGSGITNAVGVTVTFAVTSGTAIFVGNDNDCVTDASGVCSVQIVDDTPGANTIDATTTFSVGGVSLTRSTDANGNSGPDGTGSAEKTYIGGKIIVQKVTVGGDESFNFNTNYSSDFQLSDGKSNDSGYLPTGSYSVSEDVLPGWDSDGGVCDNQQAPDDITLGSGETITCTFTNTKRGKVIVTKYDWDNEKVLSDWTIRLDGLVATTSANGQVTFNNLIPGNYNLSEDLKTGWRQRSISCEAETSNNENNSLDLYVGPGDTVYCDIWNQNQEPILTIAKTNNATENKSPNDVVTYTLTVTIDEEGGPAENVKVIDLLPKGFTYNSSSWTASSNLHGTLNVPEPTYASPGTWNLVDTTNSNTPYIFNPGDVITLRYNATINGSQATGLYYDNAWSQGTAIGNSTVIFASADPDATDGNIGDSTFVGTQVSIINPNQPGVDYKATSTKEVLGASTYLPATGENTLWVIIATLLMGLGLGTTLVGIKLRKRYE